MLTTHKNNKAIIVKLTDAALYENMQKSYTEVKDIINNAENRIIILNFTDVTFINNDATGFIVNCCDVAQLVKKNIFLENDNMHTRKCMTLAGINDVIKILD